MRKPTEKGLASIATPRRCSIAKVSRALWPSASTTWSARSCSPPASVTPRAACPSSISRSTTCWPKRISPPSASISARIFSTMPTSRKVPMCGLADEEDLFRRAGLDELGQHLAREVARVADLAPQLAVARRCRRRLRRTARSTRGSSTPWRHRPQVSLVRSRTALPRSSTIGRRPICARISAAKMPQGPKPTTTGRGRPDAAEVRRRMADEAVARVGRGAHMAVAGQPRQHGGFVHAVGELAVDGVDQHHRRLLARVPGAAEDRQLAQLVHRPGPGARARRRAARPRHGRAAGAVR